MNQAEELKQLRDQNQELNETLKVVSDQINLREDAFYRQQQLRLMEMQIFTLQEIRDSLKK